MEVAGEFLSKVRQTERGAVASAAGDEVGELVELTRKGELGRVGQQRVIDVLTDGLGSDGLHAHLVSLLGRNVSGTAQDGAHTGVSVLHVVHRVGVVALLNGLNIEVDHLVGALGDERVASGIGADLVDELLQSHHGALALGHTDGLAVAQQVDELAQQNLKLAGIAKSIADAADALDVAVVVGTPDVDDVVNALELIPVIGNVGGEVGVLAVGLDQDAVLVIAQVGGAEPQGAVLGVEVTHLVELLKGAVNGGGAGGLALGVLHVQRTLGVPTIEVAIDGVAEVAHVVDHLHIAALAEALHALLRIGVDPLIAVGAPELGGLVDNVVAAIGVLAKGLGKVILVRMGLGMLVVLVGNEGVAVGDQQLVSLIDIHALLGDDVGKLHIARADGVAEGVHLRAVVVDVELTLDVVTGVVHNTAERVAQRGPAAVANVHGADGVGGNELDLGLQATTDVGLSEVHALLASLAKDGILDGNGEVEVDEAGACDLDFLNRGVLGHMGNDGLGDLARGAVGQLGGLQGHGRGPLAMRSVSRSLDSAIVKFKCGKVAGLLGRSKRSAYQLFNLLGHRSSLC